MSGLALLSVGIFMNTGLGLDMKTMILVAIHIDRTCFLFISSIK
jgi:hypothetical protein